MIDFLKFAQGIQDFSGEGVRRREMILPGNFHLLELLTWLTRNPDHETRIFFSGRGGGAVVAGIGSCLRFTCLETSISFLKKIPDLNVIGAQNFINGTNVWILPRVQLSLGNLGKLVLSIHWTEGTAREVISLKKN